MNGLKLIFEKQISSPKELEAFSKGLYEDYLEAKTSRQIISLSGPMGSGKTELVKTFFKILNEETFCEGKGWFNKAKEGSFSGDSYSDGAYLGKVQSPTFSIHHKYSLKGEEAHSKFEIDHFDLYRMKSPDEIDSTGFWELLQEEEFFVFIEWPEKMNTDQLPFHIRRIHIEIIRDLENQKLDSSIVSAESTSYEKRLYRVFR